MGVGRSRGQTLNNDTCCKAGLRCASCRFAVTQNKFPSVASSWIEENLGGSGERKNLLLSSSRWMQLSLYDYQETIGELRQLPCPAVSVGITRCSVSEAGLFLF